jgi:prepilin-type N-terminal cleavage/methylation domain-containing protein
MQQIKLKRGFTLVELLLAIFLVGLFAYFIFATPGEYKAPKVEVNASNLPTFFQKNLNGDGEVVCIDNCRVCYYITINPNPTNAPLPMNLSVKNEFILDKNDNPVKLDLGRYKDKKVCMRFRHYKNGSISQVILDLGDKALFIPSYFGEGKLFSTVNEAADWWVKDSQNGLRSKGDWY